MQAVVLDDFLGREASDVCRNLRTDAEPLGHRLKRACWRFRQRELRGVSHPHCEQVGTDYAFCSLDDKPILQWPNIPRYLDVRGPVLALRCHAPLVKQEVGVASVCCGEGFRVFDGAQKGFSEI